LKIKEDFVMALAANVRPGSIFKLENTLWEVVHFHHVQRPRLAPLVRLKMRNFKLGTIVERTFSPDDKFEDARIDERKLQYMYRQGDSFHFMDTDNYEQYEFNEKQVGEQANTLRKRCSFPCLYMRERYLESTSPTKSTFASYLLRRHPRAIPSATPPSLRNLKQAPKSWFRCS
jgi:translation elongation factor P/translation initiation factor 5A